MIRTNGFHLDSLALTLLYIFFSSPLLICIITFMNHGQNNCIPMVESLQPTVTTPKKKTFKKAITNHVTIEPTTITITATATTTKHETSSASRRDWIKDTLGSIATATFGGTIITTTATTTATATLIAAPQPVYAKTANGSTSAMQSINPLERLLEAQDTLNTLLSNWKRATVDCTYADVPRELLETKNKELLLEKASTFALFDKSVSVESCKTTNRIVRDYLGITGKGPLVGIDKVIRRGLDNLADPDDLEEYVTELETFSQAYARASSLSYAAGIADFDSVNNFSKEDATSNDDVGKTSPSGSTSNLEQSRLAIVDAKTSLDKIVSILQKEG